MQGKLQKRLCVAQNFRFFFRIACADRGKNKSETKQGGRKNEKSDDGGGRDPDRGVRGGRDGRCDEQQRQARCQKHGTGNGENGEEDAPCGAENEVTKESCRGAVAQRPPFLIPSCAFLKNVIK
jgi:hypothetical protein